MPSSVYNKLVNYLVDYTANSHAKCIKYNTDFMCSTKSYSPDDHLPYLWFQIGGFGFQLAPSQYMLTGTDSCAIGYDCMGISFLDSMGDHTYILGDTFLREYYLVFDESNYQIGLGSMEEEMSAAIPRPPVNELWKYIEIGSYVIGALAILVCIVASCLKLRKSPHFWAWREQQHEMWRKEREQEEQLLSQSHSVRSDDISTIDPHQHYQYQPLGDDGAGSVHTVQHGDDGDRNGTGTASTLLADPSTMTEGLGRPTSTNLNDEDYRSKIRELRQAFLDSNIVTVHDEHGANGDPEHDPRQIY